MMPRILRGGMARWRAMRRRGALAARKLGSDHALRAELFSAEQMERHGRALAQRHRLAAKGAPDWLLARLEENERVLQQACMLLGEAAEQGRVTPAAEWLLDNFYLVEEQVRTARRHLPRAYSRELPRLAGGPSAGMPRVYDIALEAISHGDGRLDLDRLRRFVAAYQGAAPLRLGELWAIPIMLRLALIENLRRVAARVLTERHDRAAAGGWADRMMDAVERDPKSLVLVVADMARSEPPLSSAFVAELNRRLVGQNPAFAMPLSWVDHWVAEAGQSVEALLQLEARAQAADQVSIGNSIGSLRALAAVDWRDFVEGMSLVDAALRAEPAGVYPRMDFASRDRYRHVVEQLARRSRRDEVEVARAAVAAAEAASADPVSAPLARHVGYHLVDAGLPAFRASLGLRDRAAAWREACGRRAFWLYLAPLLLGTAALAAPMLLRLRDAGLAPVVEVLAALAVVLVASQLALSLLHWIAGLVLRPRTLPQLDFSEAIPADAAAAVAVPTLLSGGLEGVQSLVEALEVRYLANRDPALRFVLLTDHLDAPHERMPGDEDLVDVAARAIAALNARHCADGADRFFLLHRPRVWNGREGCWMGVERKRGKLGALNALLRGGDGGEFSRIVGDPANLRGLRYVIVLDTDTQLPHGSAAGLLATIAHPLNQPVVDPRRRIVTRGYGILQPRVGTSLSSRRRSRFALLFGGDAGVDPYTRAVSDMYQDAFAEGSFVGKGVYEVEAFETVLGGRLPENAILSHDLLEGCHARSGLQTEVELFEEYPGSHASDASRRHRWIRGDWQLLPWLLPWVPVEPVQGRRWQRNPLSALSRWKLFDNLRRSLVPPALVGLFALAWLRLPEPGLWTLALLAVPVLPFLLGALLEGLRKPRELPVPEHLAQLGPSLAAQSTRIGLQLSWLAHEAQYSVDAALRSLWRLLISRRRMLQWRPSSEVERAGSGGLSAQVVAMAPSLLVVVATGVALALWRPEALPYAAPLLLAWCFAPVLAWRSALPRPSARTVLDADAVIFLRRLARRTWAFFEAHVVAEENWLPPDNLQVQPSPVIAHRTSPTNIGLSLLANLSAYDFGYLGAEGVLARCEATLRTMEGMERFRGHFYNWYDTRTLVPLEPRYVSSVDSGNLAGHLLTLRAGLLELMDAPLVSPARLDGAGDTLGAIADAFPEGAAPATLLAARDALAAAQARLATTAPGAIAAASVRAFLALAPALDDLAADPALDALPVPQAMARALAAECRADAARVAAMAPWLTVGDASADAPPDGVTVPSLADLQALAEDSIAGFGAGAAAAARELAAVELGRIHAVAALAQSLAHMRFDFLYDRERHLLSIGYNVNERRLDPSAYDLLASEARLASFVAIAQGQLPQEGWFRLGRLLAATDGDPVLLSWSGSMFEYLMPHLVMPAYEGSLLEQTMRAAVARQIQYGRQRGVPWGVSESGYNTVDMHLNYQYRAFGVPGLGLQRGLGEHLVIAPYATLLAVPVEPLAAVENLRRMVDEGFLGDYGMYEAIDYTPARLPRGQAHAVVRSWMAHHQGMALVALGNALLGAPMPRRFEADPQFRATLLLLQERVPRATAQFLEANELPEVGGVSDAAETRLRVLADPDSGRPAVQLLSNGRYHVMVNSAGAGYSRRDDLALTRWREDPASDALGNFLYLRDVGSGETWSAAHQPVRKPSPGYEAIFTDARVEFRRRDADIEQHTEIVVSPEDDIELRRTTLVNRGRTRRTIELTSYAEVVLASAISDALHPAFGKLFVQTEILRPLQAIVCTRRPRAAGEATPWLCHLLAVHGADAEAVSYETDRARFIGRGNTLARPAALQADALSDAEGSVLDPVVAIRCRITLEPDQTATVDLVTGVADARDGCLALIEKYRDRRLADRVFDLAWTHSQVLLRQLNASQSDAQLYERLAGAILYATPAMRAEPGTIARNRRGQSGLWGHAISGDLPIVLLQVADAANIELVRQLVQAHAYWRLKGLAVDLVIWNDDRAGYRQHLQDLIMGLITGGIEANQVDKPGGIFVRPAHQISSEDRMLVQAVARVVLSDDKGTLAEQVARRPLESPLPRALDARGRRGDAVVASETPEQATLREGLVLRNPLGGFAPDGREYVIRLGPGQETPAPWVNVLANPHFGTVVSERGSAYTWGENAHEFRLTPWANDPVSDPGGEAFYIRDEETGDVWSPSPWPARGPGRYTVRHGFGYSVFEHSEDGIDSELTVFVALDASVKFWKLRLRNRSGRARRLTATGMVEWVLGDLRQRQAMHLVTELDGASDALLARNSFNMEFPDRTAFFDVVGEQRSHSADRIEFLGRNRLHAQPAALGRARLSGRTGAGLDPCAALQVVVELGEGEERDVVFRMGLGRDRNDARALVARFRSDEGVDAAFDKVRAFWDDTLGVVQVSTPDPALDVLANGWLMYQTIACRFMARSGFYQSGGAFGFRDQLQDGMAMLHAAPARVRAHLLLSAAHQFPEGDVQHWWHPPQDRGVRTRCSDDYLWLPLAVARYVAVTGDEAVLDEPVGYIEGRLVNHDEESYYDLPVRSALRETLYEHCLRALKHATPRGQRGLPLMLCGDWNDGMNRVGEQGRGESVWLGFFLHEVLQRFGALAERRGDADSATRCREDAVALRNALDAQAWDGAWYRRAWFDDGTPLGAKGNVECEIDSIAQSWSVLSGAGKPERQRQAMASLDQRLVRRDTGIVQLLDPPFDTSDMDPGYIKGYVPGVRENGGQYTHAAVWATMAFAELGDAAKAWELFDLINPVRHGSGESALTTYKVEPYVLAADVYGVSPHEGRGGWTWYTGSAGWMYRLLLESLLGIRVENGRLRLRPVLRPGWDAVEVRLRHGASLFRIAIRTDDVARAHLTVDGLAVVGDPALVDDGAEHRVELVLPAAAQGAAGSGTD
jgi:cyclic beta-1,2-glucan synthetase